MASEVVKLDKLSQAVADPATPIEEVMDIRDKAFGMAEYLRTVREAANRVEKEEKPEKLVQSFEAEKTVAAVRLRAERRIGEELKKIEKPKGAREKGTNRGTTQAVQAASVTPEWYQKLERHQRTDWQKIARIPDKKFEEYLANPKKSPLPNSQRAESGIPTTKGLVTLAKIFVPVKKEKPEKNLSADQLAKLEHRKQVAADKLKQNLTKRAFTRTEDSSKRLIGRVFTLYRCLTPKERNAFNTLVEERAAELIDDPLWGA